MSDIFSLPQVKVALLAFIAFFIFGTYKLYDSREAAKNNMIASAANAEVVQETLKAQINSRDKEIKRLQSDIEKINEVQKRIDTKRDITDTKIDKLSDQIDKSEDATELTKTTKEIMKCFVKC